MKGIVRIGLVVWALALPLAAPAAVPEADKTAYAAIDKTGAIVEPYGSVSFMLPFVAPDAPPKIKFNNKTVDGQAICWTEDATDHHVIATFAPNIILNALEPNGLIHITRFDPAGPLGKDFFAGYARVTGEIVVPPDYDDAGPYGPNNLAPVNKGGSAGFVDQNGKMVIPMTFMDAGAFGANGLAPVKTGSGWGYIDATGAFVISPRFADARSFSANGLAPAKKDDLWVIDQTGAFVIAPAFDDAWSFNAAGRARVKHQGREQAYLTQTFGAWTLKATIYAEPEYRMIGPPEPRGLIELKGQSADGQVRWEVSTKGWGLDVVTDTTTPPDFFPDELNDFPDQDGQIADRLMMQADHLKPEEKADLAARRADLLAALAAMRQASHDLFGKLTGPLTPCLPPTCIY